MKKKNFLVTGGTGFIGSEICKLLVKLGHNVIIFDNNSRGKGSRIAQIRNNLKCIKGDIRDIKLLEKQIPGHDTVIHLACISNDPSFELNPGLISLIGNVTIKGSQPAI